MNHRMQRFDAAVQNFGKTGHCRNFPRINPFSFEKTGRVASGDNVEGKLLQSQREFLQAGFIRNSHQRFWVYHRAKDPSRNKLFTSSSTKRKPPPIKRSVFCAGFKGSSAPPTKKKLRVKLSVPHALRCGF